MEKRSRLSSLLIGVVLFLTVFNILPTIFFYTKPLKKQIDKEEAMKTASAIAERVNALEQESEAWIYSFCNLIGTKKPAVSLQEGNPRFLTVTFVTQEEAERFRAYLPRAGSLISFVPAQLSLYGTEIAGKTVTVQRRISLEFDRNKLTNYFQYEKKRDSSGAITPLYHALVLDRVIQLGTLLSGPSENAFLVQAAFARPGDAESDEMLFMAAQNLVSFVKGAGEHSSVAKRFFASFAPTSSGGGKFAANFASALATLRDKVKLEMLKPQQEKDPLLEQKEKTLASAQELVKKYASWFNTPTPSWDYTQVANAWRSEEGNLFSLKGHNPFVESIEVQWDEDRITLNLYKDFSAQDLETVIYGEIANLSREGGESIKPTPGGFSIALSSLPDSSSFLAFRLAELAEAQILDIKKSLEENWHPKHPDLQRSVFPITDFQSFNALPEGEKRLGLVFYAPSLESSAPPKGFKTSSIYVIARGVNQIIERLREDPSSEAASQFMRDFTALRTLLYQNGLFGYPGNSFSIASQFTNDFLFEGEDYYQVTLKATRENFHVHGSKRYAMLEFSTVEERLLTDNKIDDEIHEDLLKWRDDYYTASVDIRDPTAKYSVPKPTRNVFWDNLKLSFVKYFRGDDRKILHWGLDLSGGKTVHIELRDTNNHLVTNEADIRQGINELYSRVNKMGVSEVTLRQEGNAIALDFPGSHEIPASELIKASSMTFHVVNEKFMRSPSLKEATARFLQEVWNEAVVTSRKEIGDIQAIAWRHLYGSNEGGSIQPKSPSARLLYEGGLRLQNPQDPSTSSALDESFSIIARLRGDDFAEWHGASNPLMIVFRNYALEGSSLEHVRASYDANKGNFLAFEVKSSQQTKEGLKLSPRDDLEAWSSRFSKEGIAGTPLETLSHGEGWRMAVILNGSIITAPRLDSPLRDSASITGSFTQREITTLEADLKAGSLSFTPKILSEQNVSPELGAKERFHGILATLISLLLVIVTMVIYYRFGGLVASLAVIFNLLMMWAALQNIGATLSLAGIAGVILTVAMAVDANVLVFERIREEFAVSGKIASAVHTGYRKALSAIIDSNITTIIAALVLLNFDSGPIRGFAITLIIGIVSSLFSSLFMTKVFFAKWVENPEHRELKMMNLIKSANFNFLKYTKPTLLLSAVVIAIGCFMLFTGKERVLGMDFTGGYALTVQLPPKAEGAYRLSVEKALIQAGATSQDFQIRELSPAQNVRIFLSRNLERVGKPFHAMPLQTDAEFADYAYQNNPKIVWVVSALAKAGIALSSESQEELSQNWVDISGQLSESMRFNALLGLSLALLCILVYITLRFEFKYAISATLCLLHDVIFCLGFIVILNRFGVPIQIDLHTVAALLTIVGYSLNDTIIVFDRIREERLLMRGKGFEGIVNHALNVTLSRTLMTSGITLLVLLPLLFLGGTTLFGFTLVMAIGVIFGTLSSLFVAAPLMLYFHTREERRTAA